jgi:L-methionine (R)-S-oxide reductase
VHTIEIPADQGRAAIYRELLPSLRAVVADEPDLIANLANITAVLYQAIPGVSWVGFYRKIGDDLVLGPFQGRLACTRIARGRGVCGAAAERAATVVVDDVDAFPGHIACDSASRSEIVVPVVRGGQVVAVLDVDSDRLANFDAVDGEHLAHVAALAASLAW